MSRLQRSPDPVEETVSTLTGEIEVVPPLVPGKNEPLPGRILVFFIVGIALLMASVDATIVATALYSIQEDLGAGIEWSGWTITIYSLGQILIMPLAGKLSDMYGRKRVFLISIILFTGASLACGLVSNIYVLVALRFVQAIGGGAFMPSATGIISDHFGRNRDRAIGLLTSIFPIGGIIGPILGGIFVTAWGWRSIFLVNVPIGIVLIVLCVIFIPHSPLRPSKRLDVLGVVLLGVLILSTMFGITMLGGGYTEILGVGFLVPEGIAIIALVLFLLRAKYAESPYIPMKLLHGRGFGVMHLLNFLFGASAMGFGALIPLYAHDRFEIPILGAGTLLSARAVGTICFTSLAVLALRRTGYRLPMLAGFSFVIGGIVAISLVPPEVDPYIWLSIAGGVTGVGMGFAVPAANNATMHLAPENVAAIAGLRGMFRQSGSIFAVSISTAFIASSTNPGETMGTIFLVFAGVLVCALPLILLVPEHKGRW